MACKDNTTQAKDKIIQRENFGSLFFLGTGGGGNALSFPTFPRGPHSPPPPFRSPRAVRLFLSHRQMADARTCILTLFAFKKKMLYLCPCKAGIPTGNPAFSVPLRRKSGIFRRISFAKSTYGIFKSPYPCRKSNTDFSHVLTSGTFFPRQKRNRKLKTLKLKPAPNLLGGTVRRLH